MSACFAGSSTLGSSPYVPATSLPSVPIHSCPPPRSNGQGASSATSGGRAGYRLPSRHTTFTSGRVPLARNVYVIREPAGAVSLKSGVDSGSMRVGSPRSSAQYADLPHGPREGLLDVGVLACFHGEQAGRRVRVIGRGNRDRVDALRLLVEHLAVVAEALRLGVALKGVLGDFPVDVAQRVDVLALHALHVVAAHAADADASDVEPIARRPESAPQDVARHDGECHTGADIADEFPSRDALAWHDVTLLNRPPPVRARARHRGETALRIGAGRPRRTRRAAPRSWANARGSGRRRRRAAGCTRCRPPVRR